jgi:hypothetical protein
LLREQPFSAPKRVLDLENEGENQIVEVSISSCIHQSTLELFQCAQSRREV